jgi:hypothetical protein
MISYSTDVKTVLKELKGVSNISCLTPKSWLIASTLSYLKIRVI